MKKIQPLDPLSRSADLVAENLDRLKALFPEAFVEGRIEFDVLKQLLGRQIDEKNEKYGLNWRGKGQARQLALTQSLGTLRPCQGESRDWASTKNLLIEGDNLEVLKLLQKSYAGKVKLIYIDPPYNTGGDFVYQDDFHDGIRNYLQLTGQTDEKGAKLSANLESSGRYHTDWLNMMYPRLKLARGLLRQDGLIFVSISDEEAQNLRLMLDEIFGAENFIGNIVWNSTKSVTNTALISVSHTHNLVYARSKEHFVEHRSEFRLPENGEGFENPDKDPRGPWKADPFQVGGERPNQMYPISNPKTGQVYRPNPGCSWKNELEVYKKLAAENRMVFGVSGEAGPQRKRFLSEAEERGKVAKTLWDDIDTTANATKALKDLMGGSVFDNPKPTELISRMLQLGSSEKEEQIILDFFAGSGTTGHAVLKENLADSGKRRFILVQLPQALDPELKEQRAAAVYCDRLKLPRTIAEITKERIRRAAHALAQGADATASDLGFRVFKLDSSNIAPWDPATQDLQASLLGASEHLKGERLEEDIFFEILLKLGLDLATTVERRSISAKQVYCAGGGRLLACLDGSIARAEVEALAMGLLAWHRELNGTADAQVIFRDSAFADDVSKVNMTAILQQHGLSNLSSI